MAPQPSWQGIPTEIKEYVVGYLDYKTRCRLRVCSKSDRDFVDACPMAVKSLSYQTEHEFLQFTAGGECFLFRENVADIFCKLLAHKDTTVENVSLFWNYAGTAIGITERMLAKREALPKIKAKNVHIFTGTNSDHEFRRIFELFDPKHMKSIEMNSNVSQEEVDYLIETDGWKNAKSIDYNRYKEIRIDAVLHLDYFKLLLKGFNAVDAWKLINSFINRESLDPQKHGFDIRFDGGLTEEQIVAEFKTAPRKVYKPEHVNNLTEPEYKYHFRTKTDGWSFVVAIEEVEVFGYPRINGFVCKETESGFISLKESGTVDMDD